jgi:hypothetical protein
VGPFVRDLLQELPRIPPPRAPVNKGIEEKGRVPLRKHRDRCGCRKSYLGSDHNGGQVFSMQLPKTLLTRGRANPRTTYRSTASTGAPSPKPSSHPETTAVLTLQIPLYKVPPRVRGVNPPPTTKL